MDIADSKRINIKRSNDGIIKAKSPAGFAEEYLIESIWKNRFPPGSILPAERELSELIGVTRTTLREVLQRLARDGWLTIRHGKPTQVNNFWETSSLSILEDLVRLDPERLPELVRDLLSARTNISVIFIRAAIKRDPERVVEIIAESDMLPDTKEAYTDYDFHMLHQLAFLSGNLVYALILNGFDNMYRILGKIYFEHPEARHLARDFYQQLRLIAENNVPDDSLSVVRNYGMNSGLIWQQYRDETWNDICAAFEQRIK
ncbi:MAG: GntR family negative regulator for fad regulon and positive regulator of fabA [Moritella sp.]|jgi:GntR family negative regulator for fad regulon and positive regulator of fabA